MKRRSGSRLFLPSSLRFLLFPCYARFMSRKELEGILDYILNRADEGEFEVIMKACERRAKDHSFGKVNGMGPLGNARQMAENFQNQLGYSLDGIRDMVRDYVAEMIRQKAPEVSEAELEALLEAYVPDPSRADSRETEYAPGESRIPPAALLEMVTQFVEYSSGGMAPSRQKALWEQMPRWQDEYWAAFSPDIKALIKGYLEGKLDGDSFTTAILSILGL